MQDGLGESGGTTLVYDEPQQQPNQDSEYQTGGAVNMQRGGVAHPPIGPLPINTRITRKLVTDLHIQANMGEVKADAIQSALGDCIVEKATLTDALSTASQHLFPPRCKECADQHGMLCESCAACQTSAFLATQDAADAANKCHDECTTCRGPCGIICDPHLAEETRAAAKGSVLLDEGAQQGTGNTLNDRLFVVGQKSGNMFAGALLTSGSFTMMASSAF